MNKIAHLVLIAMAALCMAGCQSDLKPSGLTVQLEQGFPNDSLSLKWSPKGEKMNLTPSGDGYEAELFLGDSLMPPVRLFLYRDIDSRYFNRLAGDWNRNGDPADDSVLTCSPSELRGKIWSSFDAMVDIPFSAEGDKNKVINRYPVSFWYVFDPAEEAAEQVLRFSRRGWMTGTIEGDSLKGSVLITDMKMDGVFDQNDSWALAMPGSEADLFTTDHSRAMSDHNWLGDKALRVVSVDPSGRLLTLERPDPGMSLEEELASRDQYASDRNAPRSGAVVPFLHDYQSAVDLASAGKKSILLDFETTWCGPCKLMDQWVYTADAVVERASNLIAVKIDGDQNRELVKKYQVNGYPTLILLDPSLNETGRRVGYQSIKQMLGFLPVTE